MIRSIFYYILILALITTSCTADKKESDSRTGAKVPEFSYKNAYDKIQNQVRFGPRNPGSEGAKKAIAWMGTSLTRSGWSVQKQLFSDTLYTGEVVSGTNIIGRYKPRAKKRVLLCAHWDSRMIADKDRKNQNKPILGADDGASGVAILLEIAAIVNKNPLDIGLDIVLFDLEDQGEDSGNNGESWGLGSQYWALNLPDNPYNVEYGILLDMVGGKDAEFPKEGISMQVAPQVVNKIWSRAQAMGYGKYFVNKKIGGITDDHYFIYKNANIPVIDIIHHKNGGFTPVHHTHGDNTNNISLNTLKAVGEVVLAVIYNE